MIIDDRTPAIWWAFRAVEMSDLALLQRHTLCLELLRRVRRQAHRLFRSHGAEAAADARNVELVIACALDDIEAELALVIDAEAA